MADPGPPKSTAPKRALAKQNADSEFYSAAEAPVENRNTQTAPLQQPAPQAGTFLHPFTESEKQTPQPVPRQQITNAPASKMLPAAAGAAAIAPAIASTTPKAPQPYTARLGLVSLVNNSSDFVLINIGTAPAPPPGSRLQSYSAQAGATAAELSVSNYQRRPFLIADIISGNPKVGDSVVQVSRSGAIVAPGAVPRSTTPTTSGPLISSEPRLRPKTEIKDTKSWSKSDSNSPNNTIFFDPAQRAPVGGSEAIIPGLPIRRGN